MNFALDMEIQCCRKAAFSSPICSFSRGRTFVKSSDCLEVSSELGSTVGLLPQRGIGGIDYLEKGS